MVKLKRLHILSKLRIKNLNLFDIPVEKIRKKIRREGRSTLVKRRAVVFADRFLLRVLRPAANRHLKDSLFDINKANLGKFLFQEDSRTRCCANFIFACINNDAMPFLDDIIGQF